MTFRHPWALALLLSLSAAVGTSPLAAAPPAATPAANDLTYKMPEAPPAPDPGPLLLRLFVMTAFVLLLCAGVLWGVRYIQRPRVGNAGKSDNLRQLACVPLVGRCSLYLIQAGQSRVVVAVDPGGMKACHLIDEPFAAAMAEAQSRAQPEGPTVAEMMAALAAQRTAA